MIKDVNWLNGYIDAIDGLPSEKQWEEIKECVKELADRPTYYPPFKQHQFYTTPIECDKSSAPYPWTPTFYCKSDKNTGS